LRARGIENEVRTAGLYPGRVLANNAITAMAEIGIDIKSDHPKPVDKDTAAWANVIIPVEEEYASELRERFPDVAKKLHTLGQDVADPVGRDLAQYRATRDQLSHLLEAFVARLPENAEDSLS
jgi:protein-tyrosine-phosphatase